MLAATQTFDLHAVYTAEVSYVWSTLRRLGVRSADLEDVTHEVFLVVHKRGKDFDRSRPLRPWLFGIAYRVASEFRRRHPARLEVDLEESAHRSLVDAQDVAVEKARDKALVLRALDAVELSRRSVFIAHDIDGISAPEIAAELGIPLNTTYSRLRLARAEFAKAVTLMRGKP